jgi:hypothetical protein
MVQHVRYVFVVALALLLVGCTVEANSPKDHAMNACTNLGKALVKIDDGVAAEKLEPMFKEAAGEAASAAKGDAHWGGLAEALRDLETANKNSEAFSTASDAAWRICAPYVGT